jgi:adenosine deaminase
VFQLNAAAASFLPIEDREELADRITLGFDEA